MNFLSTPYGLFFLFLVILSIFILFHRRTSKSPIGCTVVAGIIFGVLFFGLTVGVLWYITAKELYLTLTGGTVFHWDFLYLLKFIGLLLALFLLSLTTVTAVLSVLKIRLPRFIKKAWSLMGNVFFLPFAGLLAFAFATTLLYLAVMAFVSPEYEHIGTGAAIVIFLFGAGIMAGFVAIACAVLDQGNSILRKYKENSNGRTFRQIKAGRLPVESEKRS